MDFKTLTYFITVAEELNFSKAAEKLYMSQPPLSNQIKALERELDTLLFVRGGRFLQLTESGKLYYRHAKEILALADKASSEVKALGKGMTGKISIGLVEGAAPNIASKWIESFVHIFPGIRFKIVDGNSDELVDKLRSGLIDLAVITNPCDHTLLNCIKVGQERITAFMSKDNPLAQLPENTIALSCLKNQPLLVPSRKSYIDMIYDWFKEIESIPNIICEMDNYLDVVALSESNIGISLFPRTSYVFNSQIVTKEVVDSERYVDYMFVWLKGKPLSLAYETFIDYVKNHSQVY